MPRNFGLSEPASELDFAAIEPRNGLLMQHAVCSNDDKTHLAKVVLRLPVQSKLLAATVSKF